MTRAPPHTAAHTARRGANCPHLRSADPRLGTPQLLSPCAGGGMVAEGITSCPPLMPTARPERRVFAVRVREARGAHHMIAPYASDRWWQPGEIDDSAHHCSRDMSGRCATVMTTLRSWNRPIDRFLKSDAFLLLLVHARLRVVLWKEARGPGRAEVLRCDARLRRAAHQPLHVRIEHVGLAVHHIAPGGRRRNGPSS